LHGLVAEGILRRFKATECSGFQIILFIHNSEVSLLLRTFFAWGKTSVGYLLSVHSLYALNPYPYLFAIFVSFSDVPPQQNLSYHNFRLCLKLSFIARFALLHQLLHQFHQVKFFCLCIFGTVHLLSDI